MEEVYPKKSDVLDDPAGDAKFIESLITPAVDYDSPKIRFIKNSGVVPEGAIKISKECYVLYDEKGKLLCCGIATAHDIEFVYEQAYVRYRDQQTLDELEDGDVIHFTNLGNANKKYTGITYQSYTDRSFDLYDPHNVVLRASHIDVLFSYPCWKDHVTFRINADDKIKGFTRYELMKKVMQRYHLLLYLHMNYDAELGKVDSEHSSGWFSPLLWLDDYTDNGLDCLEYHKNERVWEFVCIDYH